MRNSRTVVIVLILSGLLAVPAWAQVIPGRWEKVDALSVEMPITVDLKNGDRIKGEFEGLSTSELFLRTRSAQAAIPRADIEQITSFESDSLQNGILIGAAAGAGITAPIYARPSSDLNVLGVVVFLGIGVGTGALVGWGIDAINKKEGVLYQAP